MEHHLGRITYFLSEDYGKSLLVSYRIVYFFGLLLVAGAFLKEHHAWLYSRWAQIVIRCGRHSLSVFCVSVVLATLASLLITALNGDIWIQLAATLIGLAALLLIARLEEFRASARRASGALLASSKTRMSVE